MTPNRRFALAVVAAALAAVPSVALAQSSSPPIRWVGGSSQSADFDFARDTAIAHGGRASVRVHAADQPTSFANVSATIPAQPYAGHTIRFSVFLRTAELGGGGGNLWARADATSQQNVAFGTTQQTPVRGTTDWTQISLSLSIPQNAATLYIGVLSHGTGSLWIDDARLEADGGVPTMDFGFESPADFWTPPPRPGIVAVREAPRAIAPRGLANLTAFTSALGYVRFFHPSAEALGVNWDAFAVRGIRVIESAPTPDSLASALRTVFAPIAPSVAFVQTGTAVRTTVPKPADATHVVFWRHEGVGVPTGGALTGNSAQNIYHSERIIVPIGDVGREIPVRGTMAGATIIARPHVPDPSRPLVVALDGGVTISVPLALYTTYAVVPDFQQTPHAAAVDEQFTPNDRATRLAAVALSWSLFENFYPYFDVVHTDWPSALTAALRTAATDRDAASFQATLERLVAALHDGHGRVSSQMNRTAVPDVQFGWADGRVFVTAVGDSAGARGVRRGDELVAVDGHRPDSLLAEASSRISGATPQWVRSRALGVLLAGDPGSSVQTRLRASNGTERDVRLLRGPVLSLTDGRPDKVADLAPGTMYVDLGRITDADFNEALPRLEKARAIVFDMRGYPSRVNTAGILAHLTDTVIHSAHFDVPLITLPSRRDVGYVDGAWTIRPATPRLNARIVFLTGGGAISYAESTLGIVEAYKLGELVGEPSAGTNGNVNPFMLPGGFSVSWTGMLVQKRDGTPHHGVGVVPTVAVSPTVAGLRSGRDEVLERAITIVTPRPATP